MAAAKHNLFSLKKPLMGRPPIYSDPQEFENQCEEYFLWCINNKSNLTITGLALYLGFSSRGTINEYASKENFSDIVRRAMLVVENSYENQLDTFKYGGAIFALKNMGWKDQQDQNITQTITTVSPQVIQSQTPLASSEEEIK